MLKVRRVDARYLFSSLRRVAQFEPANSDRYYNAYSEG